MPELDRPALLAYLRTRAEASRPVIHAVYAGLVARVVRGDFDVVGTPRKGDGITSVGLDSGPQIKTDPGSALTLNPGPEQTPLTGKGGAV